MINCMKAWNCLEKTSDLPLSTEIIKQTHKIIMDGEDILVGKYRKSSVLAGYYIFAPVSYIERTQFLDFMKLKTMIPLMVLQICLKR